MIRYAFDCGITHIDLANNYGPPAGSAEQTFGAVYKSDLAPYRDEMIFSTKAGYDMWPGPYGDGGSRKYLVVTPSFAVKTDEESGGREVRGYLGQYKTVKPG